MEQTYGSVAGPNDVSVRSASRGNSNSSSTSSSDASSPLRPYRNKTDDDLRAPLLSPQRKQQEQAATSIPVTSDSETTSETMSVTDKLYAYDLTLATLTYQRFGRGRPARIAGEILCHTGDGYLWLLTFPPIMGLLWLVGMLPDMADDTKAFIKALYVFMLVDIVGIMLLKMVFKRSRPPHHAADPRFIGPDQHSFPSGHATRVWGVVALLVALAETRPEVLEHVFRTSVSVVLVVVVVWALLINFTRVALGRHYPSDVVAGSLIGYFVLYPVSALIVRYAGIL